MLHIILLILKIIGIVLLCILSILLFSICCALFVPLRYRIEVFREEGEGNPPFVVRAKVTWLLHLLNIFICYPADVYVRVRIFLFTLFRIPEAEKKLKKEATDKKTKLKKDKKKKQKSDASGRAETQEAEERTGQTTADADKVVVDKEVHVSGESVVSETVSEKTDQKAAGIIHKIIQKIRDLIRRIRQFLEKIKTAIQNMQYTIRHMCDKIKSMSDTIQYYKEVLESDAFRHSWELCRGQAGILAKSLKPDKIEADLIVGTGDPASTGEILAAYGMLYPILGAHVRIVGDFERAHVEGFVFIKGKIRAFTFLRVAWKFYRNKDIRTLIRLFKKEAV